MVLLFTFRRLSGVPTGGLAQICTPFLTQPCWAIVPLMNVSWNEHLMLHSDLYCNSLIFVSHSKIHSFTLKLTGQVSVSFVGFWVQNAVCFCWLCASFSCQIHISWPYSAMYFCHSHFPNSSCELCFWHKTFGSCLKWREEEKSQQGGRKNKQTNKRRLEHTHVHTDPRSWRPQVSNYISSFK